MLDFGFQLDYGVNSANLRQSKTEIHNLKSLIRCRADSIEPLPGHFAIVERHAFVADDLVGFVPFAGNQHAIARPGLGERQVNRLGPIGNLQRPAGSCESGEQVGQIAWGSSLRGLSVVMIATSAAVRTPAAIRGRFSCRVRRRRRTRKSIAPRSLPAGFAARTARASGVWA